MKPGETCIPVPGSRRCRMHWRMHPMRVGNNTIRQPYLSPLSGSDRRIVTICRQARCPTFSSGMLGIASGKWEWHLFYNKQLPPGQAACATSQMTSNVRQLYLPEICVIPFAGFLEFGLLSADYADLRVRCDSKAKSIEHIFLPRRTRRTRRAIAINGFFVFFVSFVVKKDSLSSCRFRVPVS